MPLDLSPESLDALQEDYDILLDEHEEATAAIEQFNRTQTEAARRQLEIQKALAEETQANVTKQRAELENMIEASERIEEISDSFGLRLIEPIAGIFSEEFSRDKLRENMQESDQQIKILNAKQSLNTQAAKSQLSAEEARVNAERAQAQKEISDVASLEQSINIQKSARADAETMRELLLTQTPTDRLDELENTAGISPELIRTEKQSRESRELSLTAQRISNSMQQRALKEQRLRDATPEQLRDPNFIKDFSPVMVRDVIRDRKLQDMAFERARMLTRDAKRSEIAATLTDKQIDAKVSNGELTEQEANQIKAQRELAKTQSQAQIKQSQAMIADSYLTGASVTELKNLRKQARENGGVASITRDGVEIELPLQNINDNLNTKTQAIVDVAIAEEASSLGQDSLNNSTNELAAMLGVPVQTEFDTPTTDKLQAMMDSDADLTADQRTQLASVKRKLKAAELVDDPEQKTTIMEQAAVMMEKVRASTVKRRMDALPDALKEPVRSYYATAGSGRGVINSSGDASLILSQTIPSNEATGIPHYDTAFTLASEYVNAASIAGTDNQRVQNLKDQLPVTLQNLATVQDKTPGEIAQLAIMSEEIQQRIATPIVNEVINQSYFRALNEIGMGELANQFASGTLPQNFGSAEETVVAMLQQKGVSLGEFRTKLRQSIRKESLTATEPQGDYGHAVAALNKLLFNNRPETYFTQFITGRFDRAQRSVIQRQQKQQAATQARSGAHVGGNVGLSLEDVR